MIPHNEPELYANPSDLQLVCLAAFVWCALRAPAFDFSAFAHVHHVCACMHVSQLATHQERTYSRADFVLPRPPQCARLLGDAVQRRSKPAERGLGAGVLPACVISAAFVLVVESLGLWCVHRLHLIQCLDDGF